MTNFALSRQPEGYNIIRAFRTNIHINGEMIPGKILI